MDFRFLAIVITLVLIGSAFNEAKAAKACDHLFSTSTSTLAASRNQNLSVKILRLLSRIRSADPEDAAPLLAELGRQISARALSERELRFIVFAIFEKKNSRHFLATPKYFSQNYQRLDLILARYERTLLSEITGTEQRARVIDLLKTDINNR